MVRWKSLAASVLLVAGVLLVFTGLSSALGFTPLAMVASIVAIAGLLYAGGIWVGAPSPTSRTDAVHIYDHALALTTGAPLLTKYPESLRAELRVRCLAALSGERTRFTAEGRTFEVLPVTSVEGTVVYGVLIEGSARRPSLV